MPGPLITLAAVLAIRDARPDDARAVATVHVSSWRAAYTGLLPAQVLDGLSVDARAAMWARLIDDTAHHQLVLTAPEVVGFAAFGPDREEPTRGELYALYLDPSWWGRGLGRRLHDATVARLDADGYAMTTLWVLRGNARAIRFYREAGWSPDGTEKVEEGPGGAVLVEDRYIREKRSSLPAD